MPPSGYNRTQSRGVEQMLRACFDALCEEAKQKRISIPRALQSEISDIQHYLDNTTLLEAQSGILHLTRAFYELLVKKGADRLEDVLGDIEAQMLSIKIIVPAV